MKKILVAGAIILLAFFFRFNNLNWDDNFHLHPDERFLTMVGTAMKIPSSISQYFDQRTSLLNPSNIGYNFFVYGRFPLILTKYLAVVYKLDNYNDFTILGRQLSAFFDLLVVILIFKVVLLFEKRYRFSCTIKYWASFFYAITVLPIQLSHFFAVDTFLNFFMFASFYFALRVGHDRPLQNTILSATFFGLALASKVTAIFIFPLNLFFLIKTVFVRRQSLIKTIGFVLFYLFISYFTLRFADPYLFEKSNIFDPTINKNFVENIKSLQNMTVKNLDNWFPPMVQWLNKNSFTHSLINNIMFGFGIVNTLFLLLGIFNFQFSIFTKFSNIKQQVLKNWQLIVVIIWVIGFFIYQSLQVTPTLRYFIFLYPFFAIFAAIGINLLKKSNIYHLGSIILLLIWPLMFSSIYFHKNTRVEASEWIYKNLPNGSYILSESWDDGLPLPITYNYNKRFDGEQLLVFDPDTPEKWQKMNESLKKADYYILSSNRGWGSIPTVSEKYPLMSEFYDKLLVNKNPSYKKIKEFRPYYYNFFKLPNDLVDESFTVYDHPTVLIYKNTKK